MPDSTEESLRDLWQQPQLRNLLKQAVMLCPEKAEGVFLHAAAMNLPPEYRPTRKTVERFKGPRQQRLNNPYHATGLLLIALDLLARVTRPSSDQNNVLSELRVANRKFCERIGTGFPGEPILKKEPPVDNSPVGSLKQLLASQFKISEDDFRELSRFFFPKIDPDDPPATPKRRYYDTYRFHSNPLSIVKTFTVIESPSTTAPACTFVNFFVVRPTDVPRRASGLIVPAPGAIYFSGGMNNGTGLKFMAAEKLPHTQPDQLNGLMITLDDRIVSARFAMVETDKEEHVSAGAGVYTLEALKEELTHVLDRIRNRIPFKLEKDIFLGDALQTQAAIVDETRRALNRGKGSTLADADGNAFNPASDDEYTFNAALRMWSASETPTKPGSSRKGASRSKKKKASS